MVYVFLNGATLLTLLWRGAFTELTLARTLALWPVQIVALWIGAALFRRSGDVLYRRLALGLILAIAVFGLLYRR
jgi:uncharacterized membrane protein YfcA